MFRAVSSKERPTDGCDMQASLVSWGYRKLDHDMTCSIYPDTLWTRNVPTVSMALQPPGRLADFIIPEVRSHGRMTVLLLPLVPRVRNRCREFGLSCYFSCCFSKKSLFCLILNAFMPPLSTTYGNRPPAWVSCSTF